MSKGNTAPPVNVDSKRWRVIYPQYLNSNLTIELGRRLPKSKAVSDPKLQEIVDVLQSNPKISTEVYPHKIYCRETDKENPAFRGYVKYHCDDPSLKNKRLVLEYVAQLIPKLKCRTNPKATVESKPSGSSAPAAGATSTAPSGGGGGKKKNRRR